MTVRHIEHNTSRPDRMLGRVRLLLVLAAVVEVSAAIFAALAGGFRLELGPLRVSAGDPIRPFAIGAACACAAMVLYDRARLDQTWDWIEDRSGVLSALVAAAALAAGVHYGAFAAGGSDQYGYVSQAQSWASGQLRIVEPLAAIDPLIAPAAVPLGYRLAGSDSFVSIYSPGFPLMMVPPYLLGGEQAVYVVVPVLGALAVWLTFVLGRTVWDPRAGLLAAVGVACSPVFLHQLFLPMSDVPATALWLAALVCALSRARPAPLFSGAAASLALLTRPNLIPLAAAVALLIWLERRRIADLVMFGVGLLPGPILIAVVYGQLYGSALSSGYGSLETLFRVEWLATNTRQFSTWLLATQSPAILLAAFALAFRRTAVTAILLVYCALTFACYAFYIPFEGWHFLRFLLPALPVLLILSAGVALALVARLRAPWRGASFAALIALLIGAYLAAAQQRGVFYVGQDQRRFLSIGTFLGRELPENAVVLAGLHSGSVRLYGHRPTLRWTQLPAAELDRAVSILQGRGFDLYILLEPDEEREFRAWFGRSSALGALDWPPLYQYPGHPGARVFGVLQRSTTAGSPKMIPSL